MLPDEHSGMAEELLQVKAFYQEFSIHLHGLPVRCTQHPGLIRSRHRPLLPVVLWNIAIMCLSSPSIPRIPCTPTKRCLYGAPTGHTMQPTKPHLPSSQPGSLTITLSLDLQTPSQVPVSKIDAVLWCFRMGKITLHLFPFPFQSLRQPCSVTRL